MKPVLALLLAVLLGPAAAAAQAPSDLAQAQREAERRFVVQSDVLVPTPDGAQIAVLIVRPRTSGKLVALLGFTIYADDRRALADSVKMAEHGYAGVIAYSRGKGRSPGPAVPYEHDGADAATVIEWIARQDWSDGRVGMYGGSYNSSTQWGAAKRMPAALKAIATSASNAPGIDTPMWRGVFMNFIYPWPLYTTKTKYLDEAGYAEAARWSALYRAWYVSGRPYREMEKLDREPNPIFAKWLQHPTYDAYWQAFTPQGREFARIDIPVLAITGYFDGGEVGVLHYLREHRRYRPQAEHRLLVGPYHHLAMGRGVLPTIGTYDIDPVARVDLQEIRLQWFDHVFHRKPLPPILAGQVNFQVMGADRWKHVGSLDEMGERAMRFYLSPGGGAAEGGLVDQRPNRPGAVELVVDLRDRSDADVETPWGPVLDKLDTRDAVVLTSAPLTTPLEVNGAFIGDLEFTTNKRDFDFGVSLYQQTPEGRYFTLAWSIYRASQVRDRRRRQLIEPGRPTRLRIESDHLTSRRMEAGSRIVAMLWVPKGTGYEINYGSGKPVADESIADAGAPLRIRWSTNSWLELRTSDPALASK